ncbi:MAG: hypothetical protein SOY53_07825 [Prevotella sp.]|nr:hypothetical protein [Prevotella sp.]MDY3620864.1 hypothetical protein [Prevotella sp.]MDY4089313.1 hypothetical protein [Prevotella sp.]
MWLEALGLLAGGLLGATIFLAVDFFLSEDKLVEEVEEQYPDAFKLRIKEKKKNAVNVGIFDEDDEHLDDVEITSTKGVSKSLRKGKVIFVKTI